MAVVFRQPIIFSKSNAKESGTSDEQTRYHSSRTVNVCYIYPFQAQNQLIIVHLLVHKNQIYSNNVTNENTFGQIQRLGF